MKPRFHGHCVCAFLMGQPHLDAWNDYVVFTTKAGLFFVSDYDNKKAWPQVANLRPETADEAAKAAITEYMALIDGMAGERSFGDEGSVEDSRILSAQEEKDERTSPWQVIQEFINAIPALVLLVDETHRILASNKTVQQHLGLGEDELKGGYCPLVVHGLDYPFPGCPLEESVKTGHWVERELFDQATGMWVSSAIYPTQWRTGQGGKIFIHTIRDITGRKNAEERLRKALGGTIEVLAAVTEVRDPYTADHARRVSVLARAIAVEMGFAEEQALGTYVAALLHDIGKIYVPVELLNRPRPLTEVEMNLVKMHPQVAYDILKDLAFPWPVALMVLQHHERVDGSGYPAGLAVHDILPEARILAVADVVEAMSSHRPYRAALGIDVALAEISRGKGILYDAKVVDACLKVFEKGFDFPSAS